MKHQVAAAVGGQAKGRKEVTDGSMGPWILVWAA